MAYSRRMLEQPAQTDMKHLVSKWWHKLVFCLRGPGQQMPLFATLFIWYSIYVTRVPEILANFFKIKMIVWMYSYLTCVNAQLSSVYTGTFWTYDRNISRVHAAISSAWLTANRSGWNTNHFGLSTHIVSFIQSSSIVIHNVSQPVMRSISWYELVICVRRMKKHARVEGPHTAGITIT